MIDFKDSVHDFCGWNMAKFREDEAKKEVVANKPFTDETLCHFVGGKYDGKVMSVKEARELGLILGKCEDNTFFRSRGVTCPYPIFDNAPRMSGYLGPFFEISTCPFRYETSKVYEEMSK